MMNEIKTVLKLIKYGDQFDNNLIMTIIWTIGGIFGGVYIGFCGDYSENISLLMFIGILAPIFMIQTFASLEAVGFVASSGKRRSLFLRGADLLAGGIQAVWYFVLTGSILIGNFLSHRAADKLGVIVLYSGIIAVIVNIYLVMINKFFIGGILLLGGLCALCGNGGNYLLGNYELLTGTGLLLGFAVMIAGDVLGGFIRRLLYKKRISKYALSMEIRKYM